MSWKDDQWNVKKPPFKYVKELPEDKPAFHYVNKKGKKVD